MLVNAAKLWIPKLWGTTKTPSLSEWYKCINKIAPLINLHLSGLVGNTSSPLANIHKPWALSLHGSTLVSDYTLPHIMHTLIFYILVIQVSNFTWLVLNHISGTKTKHCEVYYTLI